MAFESLGVSMIASETISDALRSVSSAADQAGDAAAAAGVQFGSYEEVLDSASTTGMEVYFVNQRVSNAIDEVGDQAMESAAQVGAFKSSLGGLSSSSLSLIASLGPLRGSTRAVGAAALAAAPVVASMGEALGGLATAAGGAAAGLGALAFGGLLREAERMAAASKELKSTGEALQKIFKNFGKALKDALAPLQTMANTQLTFAAMQGVVEIVRMFAEEVAALRPTLVRIGEAFGSAILDTAPAVFNQIAKTVRALTPFLLRLADAIRRLPQLFASLRAAMVRIGPELFALGAAVIHAAFALSDLGQLLGTIILPALTIGIEAFARLADMLAMIPAPAFQAIVVFVGLAAAMATYGGATALASAATTALVGAVSTLLAPLSAGIVAIAALGAALVGIISYFGWWDAIINSVKSAWNAFVGAIEWGINTLLSLYDALGMLGPVLMPGIFILTHLGDIINWVGGLFRWLGGVVQSIASQIVQILSDVATVITNVIGVLDEVTNALGLDSMMSDLEGQGVDLSGLKADVGKSDTTSKGTRKKPRPKMEQNYDFSGADFSGTDETHVQQAVREAIRAANRENRAREDAKHLGGE